MTLKPNLRYISCKDAFMAYLVASLIIELAGKKRDASLKVLALAEKKHGNGITLEVTGDRVRLYATDWTAGQRDTVCVNNWAEIYSNLLESPRPTTVKVGDYDAKILPEGLGVDRFVIPWSQVQAIAALDPAKQPR